MNTNSNCKTGNDVNGKKSTMYPDSNVFGNFTQKHNTHRYKYYIFKHNVNLDAHEQDKRQPDIEKRMDSANNRSGQLAAKKLIEENKFSEEEILKSFKDDLENKKLIIIKDSGVNKK